MLYQAWKERLGGGQQLADIQKYVLVHMNVVRPVGPFNAGHPNIQYFFHQLPLIFAKARADGDLFWHAHGARAPDGQYLEMDGILAQDTRGTQDNLHIITMAGWRDIKAMHRFTYREPLHVEGMRTLRDWVDRSDGATMVMWWVVRGTRVSLAEGWERLQSLRQNGASKDAFSLQQRFAAPE
ncbi:DUF3291 domain-containing protein [uncultured Tateyamaria sp.]|uniref:DUF3291 domain-containing protein n=1 Tax=uncultured Tateyamaria sp. TaxID=455651 RepID=UPI002606CF20|nr:DUF3291 domain-containing protein [uncultured Tateyamaria sp.]